MYTYIYIYASPIDGGHGAYDGHAWTAWRWRRDSHYMSQYTHAYVRVTRGDAYTERVAGCAAVPSLQDRVIGAEE